MDFLPAESLLRILRFLPPKTFYTQIPLVCRRFRDAASVAIPGCSSNEIGVACGLRMWGVSLGDMGNEEMQWNDTFFASDGPTGTVWTGFKCQITVSADYAVNRLEEAELSRLIENDPSGTRPTLKLCWIEGSLVNPYIEMFDSINSSAFANFTRFVQSHHVRCLTIEASGFMYQQLERVSDRVPMTQIRRFSLQGIVGDVGPKLEALLNMCPEVEHTSGGTLMDTKSATSLIERVPTHQRQGVTVFDDTIFDPMKFRRNFFVDVPRVYPNLRELGTLTIWGGKRKWSDNVVFDCRSMGATVLGNLRSIQTFGLMVFATDLLTAPSTDNFATLAKSIFEIMPGITILNITVDMVTPRRSYDEVPGCDAVVLQFLEDLLRAGKRQSRSLRARMELLSPVHGMKKLYELRGSVHEAERTFGGGFQTLARNAGVSLYTEERYVFDDT